MPGTMADSAQDRNLPASPKKLAKARAEGQVARSRDLGHFAALGVGGFVLLAVAAPLGAWLREIMVSSLRFGTREVMQPTAMTEQLLTLGVKGLWVIAPLGLLMMLLGVASAVVAGGWNVSFKALAPNFERFNPLAGLGRMFGKDHLIDVLKVIVLATALGTVGVLYLRSQWQGMAQLLMVPLPQAVAALTGTLATGFGLLLLLLGVWAAIDVPLQRHLYANRLKMSHQEVKQEFKEAEGNQEVKGKIKQRMREIGRKRMMLAVPTADLVVMNPTHYAVALKYDEASMGAPRVVAKGADLLALKIRDLARESGVPVLQAPPLARALYTHVELEGEVPAALFAAVAQVLAWVYQLRRTPYLVAPDVVVPPELDPHTSRPHSK